jgi:hypothetical protein
MVWSLEELMVVKEELYGNLHGDKQMVVTTPNSQVSHGYPSYFLNKCLSGKLTFWQVCTQLAYFTNATKSKSPTFAKLIGYLQPNNYKCAQLRY